MFTAGVGSSKGDGAAKTTSAKVACAGEKEGLGFGGIVLVVMVGVVVVAIIGRDYIRQRFFPADSWRGVLSSVYSDSSFDSVSICAC
jgi:hypothetical protein